MQDTNRTSTLPSRLTTADLPATFRPTSERTARGCADARCRHCRAVPSPR